MGREKLQETLKKDGKGIAICGVLPAIIGFLFLFVMIISIAAGVQCDYRAVILLVLGVITFIFGVVLLYVGITYSNLNKSWLIKLHPEIPELVDDLFTNTMFQNDDIIISHLAIASMKHLTSVVRREEVLSIYNCYKMQYYGKYQWVRNLYKQNLKLITKQRKIHILISGDKITNKFISEYCPNAQFSKGSI